MTLQNLKKTGRFNLSPPLPYGASHSIPLPKNKQSHFVNARTSEDWFEKNAGHVVRGRLQWLSSPIKVVKRQPPSGGSEGPIIHNADILIDTPKIMENGTAVGTGNEESQQNPEGGDGQKPPPPMVPAAGHDASVSGTSPALLEIDVEKGGHGPKAPPAALFGASVLILGGLLVCLVVRAVKKGQLFRGATAPNASVSKTTTTSNIIVMLLVILVVILIEMLTMLR